MDGRPLIHLCGDSITFGARASSPQCAYPAVLSNMLGGRADVEGFGSSGATLMPSTAEDPGRAYTERMPFQASLKGNLDMVVLMLGMNDANPLKGLPAQNGGGLTPDGLAQYRREAEALLRLYRQLPSHPQTFFCLTTPFYRYEGMRDPKNPDAVYGKAYVDHFRANLALLRQIQPEIAKDTQSILLDTYTPMMNELYYFDGVHPNDQGYFALAGIMYTALLPHIAGNRR